jgi:DNA-binding Xre family transcriptional regulator
MINERHNKGMAVSNRLFQLIKDREKETGKTLEITALSEATQVSRQAIYQWLKGDAKVYHQKAINAFCKYFGVGVGDLLVYVPDEADRETA